MFFYYLKITSSHALLGVFGLNLLLLKTENWKYCSKINFKCVNSIVRPIFNTWTVYKQYINSEYTVYNSKICPQKQQMRAKKKKKKAENVKGKRGRGAQTPPMYIYVVKKIHTSFWLSV